MPIWRQFPQSFWIANVMEIFERMGWYGFFAVSTLYLTNSVADGGLGFSSTDRGVIQGIATFFLYLFPAVFGALADRYGYKRIFLSSVVACFCHSLSNGFLSLTISG
jgi:POT family proton-dependent oligopeptide transporter